MRKNNINSKKDRLNLKKKNKSGSSKITLHENDEEEILSE
jgi:hypothetical protein